MKNKILITGADGFIGSSLRQRMKALDKYDIYTFDIRDGDISTDTLPFYDIDHVIHLAARIFIPESWQVPLTFYRTNVQGTANVLDFCRKQNASLTYISAYVYGKPEALPISEKHPLSPNNPYMHSKVMAESLCEFYAHNFQVPVCILRPFNIMGPGQSEKFLIPKLLRQLKDPAAKALEVNDLRPKRDFLYIDDLNDAIIRSIEIEDPLVVYNVGSGNSYSVAEIIKSMLEISGIDKEIISRKQERKSEIPDVRADISKIRTNLGWEPAVSFHSGIERIINT